MIDENKVPPAHAPTDKLAWAVFGALVLALAGGSFYAGCWYEGVTNAATEATLRIELTACQRQVSDAQAYGEGINAAMAQTEQELLQLKNQKVNDEKLYQDSLAVIRTMLPDRAERELARYYQNQRR